MYHIIFYSDDEFPLTRIRKLLNSLSTITVLVKKLSVAGTDEFFFYNFSGTVITCFCFISIEIEYNDLYAIMVITYRHILNNFDNLMIHFYYLSQSSLQSGCFVSSLKKKTSPFNFFGHNEHMKQSKYTKDEITMASKLAQHLRLDTINSYFV